jgi:hypothetical protein
MQFATDVITHTPPFVWVVLALIIYRMWRGMRKRWVSLTSLMIQAALFIVLGAAGLYLRAAPAALGWALAAVLLFPAGFFTAPHPLSVDRNAGKLLLPASILMPVRLLVIFVVRYGLAVVTALHPDRRAALDLATSLFSGAVAGYYIGWSACLLRAYWRAPVTVASKA